MTCLVSRQKTIRSNPPLPIRRSVEFSLIDQLCSACGFDNLVVRGVEVFNVVQNHVDAGHKDEIDRRRKQDAETK